MKGPAVTSASVSPPCGSRTSASAPSPRDAHFADFNLEYLVLFAFGVGFLMIASLLLKQAGALTMLTWLSVGISIWLSNVFRLGLKEMASLASDKVLVAFIIYSFSFSVYSVATGVKTEIENASIAVVDSDRSALSSRLHEAFLRPYFRPPAIIDRSMLDPAMDRGERTFVLDIPPRFEADALRGRQPELQLNIDATAMTQAGVGAGYIGAIVQQEAADFLQSRGDAPAFR